MLTTHLIRRIKTALFMSAIALLLLALGGWWLSAGLAGLALLMLHEWDGLTRQRSTLWRLMGVPYIAIPLISLIIIRNLDFMESQETALYACLAPIFMVIATDIGAMLCGKLIGGAKLAPKLSPNKTWAGLLGGMGCAAVVSYLWAPVLHWPESGWTALLLGAVIAVIAQMGDLFESYVKRRAGVKDSGGILPGHGGLLDRFDGYVLVLPCYLVLILLKGQFVI